MVTTFVSEEVTLAFPTIIFQRVLKNREDVNETLASLIREREQSDPGRARSNVGGWHSTNDLFAWDSLEAKNLQRAIAAAVKEIFAFQSELSTDKFQLVLHIEGWANVNRKGDYNKLHVHPNANWSGVYYVDVGKPVADTSGRLEFLDPRNRPGIFQTAGTDRSDWLCFQPESGAMMIFPAWLYHTATPYDGEGERISIAFNVVIQKVLGPNGEPFTEEQAP